MRTRLTGPALLGCLAIIAAACGGGGATTRPSVASVAPASEEPSAPASEQPSAPASEEPSPSEAASGGRRPAARR